MTHAEAENTPKSWTLAEQVARGLGWFSFGLGAAELVAPGRLARWLGLEGKEGLIRFYGAREIGAGVGAFAANPAPAMIARAAGDFVDLGTLALGLRSEDRAVRRNVVAAMAAVAGVTLVDIWAAAKLTAERRAQRAEALAGA
ncbi:MAG: hypothetical protein E6G92_07860 [Alphaproteobacteria bacterium]|nr:MAG: hypothetical protein E6G92_07860 [Alphaproteobacteria bacterium]